MNSGPMRYRFTLERNDPTPGTVNQDVEHWTPVGTYWGSLKQVSTRDSTFAERAQVLASYAIVMRYAGPIAVVTHRLRMGARLFILTEVNDVDGLRREYQIQANEVVNPR